MPTLLHLYRLACRPCRAAESCLPGNHRIRRRHCKTRNRSRRGTRPHPRSCGSFIPSRPGHRSGAFLQRDPCTVLPNRKISADAEAPNSPNKSLPLTRNWLRFAKPPAALPNLGAFVHRTSFRDPCTVLHKRKISAGAEAPNNPNKSLLLRRNWLRSAKPHATRPNLEAFVHRTYFRDPCTVLPNRKISAAAEASNNPNKSLLT